VQHIFCIQSSGMFLLMDLRSHHMAVCSLTPDM
jgi:hypothetical protein